MSALWKLIADWCVPDKALRMRWIPRVRMVRRLYTFERTILSRRDSFPRCLP